MRRSTLALVESPTQLLNVAEWAYVSGAVDDLDVAVLAPRDMHTVRQIGRVAELVARLGLGVRTYPVRSRTPAGAARAAQVLQSMARAQRLVIGDPFSRFIQTLLPASSADEVVVVDDGTSTWEFARCISAGLPLVRWGAPPSRPERRAARAGQLMSPSERRRLTVFTCLTDATPLAAAAVANRYEWTRSAGRPAVVPDEVDVLGVSLVDTGVIERAPYLAAVDALSRRYGRIRYIAHRRESPGLLTEIAAVPGVYAMRADLPVELTLRRGPVARDVVTFPSTAAHTLPIVLSDAGVRIHVCRVEESWFTATTTRHARAFVARIGDATPRHRMLAAV